jgi:hypothetical protein
MDGSGPVEYIPKGYNGAPYAAMKYANGIVMTEQPYLDDNADAQGIKFWGAKGWIEVARGYLAASDASLVPAELAGRRPMTMAQMREFMAQTAAQRSQRSEQNRAGALTFEISSPHMQDFVDCVRSRENPIAPVEVGCSTNTLCCLANIARELNRPVKWNPATLSFVNDREAAAHRLYGYTYRRPYVL